MAPAACLVAGRDRLRRVGPAAEDLHEVGVGEDVGEPAASEARELLEVAAPDLVDLAPGPGPGLHVDGLAVHEVHRAEQEVPGVRAHDLGELVLAAR